MLKPPSNASSRTRHPELVSGSPLNDLQFIFFWTERFEGILKQVQDDGFVLMKVPGMTALMEAVVLMMVRDDGFEGGSRLMKVLGMTASMKVLAIGVPVLADGE